MLPHSAAAMGVRPHHMHHHMYQGRHGQQGQAPPQEGQHVVQSDSMPPMGAPPPPQPHAQFPMHMAGIPPPGFPPWMRIESNGALNSMLGGQPTLNASGGSSDELTLSASGFVQGRGDTVTTLTASGPAPFGLKAPAIDDLMGACLAAGIDSAFVGDPNSFHAASEAMVPTASPPPPPPPPPPRSRSRSRSSARGGNGNGNGNGNGSAGGDPAQQKVGLVAGTGTTAGGTALKGAGQVAGPIRRSSRPPALSSRR